MTDTHDIVPDDVDLDELRSRQQQSEPNPLRCPQCGYASLKPRSGGITGADAAADHYCARCCEPVANPVREPEGRDHEGWLR
jgi:hypothetical protein